MFTIRRRSEKLYIPTLAITLILLYLALANVQSSTAEMMPGVMTFEATQPVSEEEITAASQVLKERLFSHSEAAFNFTIEGSQLTVSPPTGVEPSILVAEASRVGQVEVVDGGTQFLTISSMVRTGPHPNPDQDVYQAVLTSTDFEAAEARLSSRGRPVIQFTLTSSGDARLAAHTEQYHHYYLCLVIDGRVENCPILRTPLTNRKGTIELTGDATLDEARTLAMLLRSGPLPVPLKLTTDN